MFAALRSQLSEEYSVFYSVEWLAHRGYERAASEGEIDFVIAHPEHGVLILEVKGGKVQHDAQQGYQIVRDDGRVSPLNDPFAQARRNRHALIDLLKTVPGFKGESPEVYYSVAFPNGFVDVGGLGPQAARDIVLLTEDLTRVADWVRNCYRYWTGARTGARLGDAGVQHITGFLRRSWQIQTPRIGHYIAGQMTAINDYTTEQFKLLDFMERVPRAVIRGCAGSGKTMLAVEKARRLARQGFRTLLTCFNRALADHLQEILRGEPLVHVDTYHGICVDFARAAGHEGSPQWDFYSQEFYRSFLPPILLAEAQKLPPELRYDAIIVDEAQDFFDDWWAGIEALLREPGAGVLYVFTDDNQRIYTQDGRLPSAAEFSLAENRRNTRAICELVDKYRSADTPMKPGAIEGMPVRLIRSSMQPAALTTTLETCLRELIQKQAVAARDIVILSPRGQGRPPMNGIDQVGPFQLNDVPSSSPTSVHSTTVRLFKGLEAPVVITVVPADALSQTELMYVGFSRASVLLLVVLDEAAAPGEFALAA